jgi:hypothetical protein
MLPEAGRLAIRTPGMAEQATAPVFKLAQQLEEVVALRQRVVRR